MMNQLCCLAAVVALTALRTGASTRVGSADGQFWDIQDTSPWSQDSGGIATGGRANPFNGFGYLKLQVRRPTGRCSSATSTSPALAWHQTARDDSIRSRRVLRGGVIVARAIYAPPDDATTCATSTPSRTPRTKIASIEVAWGGAVGRVRGWRPGRGGDDLERRSADRRGRYVRDRHAERASAWTIRCRGRPDMDRRRTCSASRARRADLGRRHVRRSVHRRVAGLRSGAHRLCLHAHRASRARPRALMTFVVKGLSEVYDPRGGVSGAVQGSPCRRRRGWLPAPTRRFPRAGSEIARVTDDRAPSWLTAPDLRGLTARQRSQIANWNCRRRRRLRRRRSPSSRRPSSRLQDAMTRGVDDLGGRRPRVPGAAVALRSPRPDASRRCWRSTRARSPTRARATPSGPPAACAVRFTAFRSCSRTTSTCWGCRPPAARSRSSIIGRGSIRGWRRA